MYVFRMGLRNNLQVTSGTLSSIFEWASMAFTLIDALIMSEHYLAGSL